MTFSKYWPEIDQYFSTVEYFERLCLEFFFDKNNEILFGENFTYLYR